MIFYPFILSLPVCGNIKEELSDQRRNNMKWKDQQIDQALKSLPGWVWENQSIVKVFSFPAYMDGIRFVQKVAEEAEKWNHHPDIFIGYRKVTLRLTTHDQGGLTEKDFHMARQLDTLV
jgi:4a-hydroxytetrahydrobiopterin dehydratase